MVLAIVGGIFIALLIAVICLLAFGKSGFITQEEREENDV